MNSNVRLSMNNNVPMFPVKSVAQSMNKNVLMFQDRNVSPSMSLFVREDPVDIVETLMMVFYQTSLEIRMK